MTEFERMTTALRQAAGRYQQFTFASMQEAARHLDAGKSSHDISMILLAASAAPDEGQRESLLARLPVNLTDIME